MYYIVASIKGIFIRLKGLEIIAVHVYYRVQIMWVTELTNVTVFS